jgi:hypothetical protein
MIWESSFGRTIVGNATNLAEIALRSGVGSVASRSNQSHLAFGNARLSAQAAVMTTVLTAC